MKSKRFEELANRAVNNDGFVNEWSEVGMIAMDSPYDPKPSIKIENGKITQLDGKPIEDFDFIDSFIANNAIDLSSAQEAMAINSVDFAKMLVDINSYMPYSSSCNSSS